MRAVNLIPSDAGGASRGGSRGGAGGITGAHALLGGLAVLVAASAAWTLTDKTVSDRQADVERITAQAQAAEVAADAATPYQAFAQLAQARSATVKSLSETRFDWSVAMREIGRVLPADVWLTAMDGTSGGDDAAPSPTTSAAPAPQFKLSGCTGSQARVAGLLARLRAVDGVRTVALRSSSKPEGTTGGQSDAAPGPAASVSAADGECPANTDRDTTFEMTVRFAVPNAPKPPVDPSGQVIEAQAAAPSAGVAPTEPASGGSASAPEAGAPAPSGEQPAAPTTPATSPNNSPGGDLK